MATGAAALQQCANGALNHAGERAFADFQAEMRGLLRKCLARPCPPEPADVSIGAQVCVGGVCMHSLPWCWTASGCMH